ncbi:MAG: response regulator [Alphaproteobacteria bacterium]|nr:response regulator [Alphaproteobacteria bacterium]
MQTITDKTEIGFFLTHMSRSFGDLSCWRGWFAFEFSAARPLIWTQQAKVTSLVRSSFADGEGVVLWTEDSVLCILRVPEGFDFAAFTQSLYDMSESPRIILRMLNVYEEHKQMLALVAYYNSAVAPTRPPPHASYGELKNLVPGIDELLKNWHAIKQRRAGRATPHIMIVDDDAMMVTLVTHVLRQNYKVIVAISAREAMEKHLSEAPDIVFLDMGLPDCNGLTAMNYMQQFDPDSQIVIFSDDTSLKTQVMAMSGGADGFIAKPLNWRAFETYILRWKPVPAPAAGDRLQSTGA